ncbi:MAG: NTP transferase domain-containing protein, partial [Planctomycetales bacterium]|nr:NTP transferase domain-containing protein [Planctomycetales bacterium]
MLSTLGIVDLFLTGQPQETIRRKAALLTRCLDGKSMLEWIIRRATESQWLDGVIVLTGQSPEQRELAARIPPDVPVFVSGAADPLAACVEALGVYTSKSAVLIATDTPLVDPDLIDRLVRAASGDADCDSITYQVSDGPATAPSKVGLFAQWCSAAALARANRKAASPAERATATQYIYAHQEFFRLRLTQPPAELDRADLRLRVESEEDWDHVASILEALGPEDLQWQSIVRLLQSQPELRQRMAL